MSMKELNWSDKRSAVNKLKETSETGSEFELTKEGVADWEVYRSDASEYFLSDEWQERVRNFFDKLHQNGEKAVYVDLCGTANGATLGADKSYGFSLQIPKNLETTSKYVLIEGDIFSSKDFQKLLSQLKHDEQPALVTFEPYGGIQGHIRPTKDLTSGEMPESEVKKAQAAYYKLGSNLKKLIEILKPGGFILIGDFGVLPDHLEEIVHALPQELESIARQANCSLEYGEHGRFLLRKTELMHPQ